MTLGIHNSIKTEVIIKLNEDKLRNACCYYVQNIMIPFYYLKMYRLKYRKL